MSSSLTRTKLSFFFFFLSSSLIFKVFYSFLPSQQKKNIYICLFQLVWLRSHCGWFSSSEKWPLFFNSLLNPLQDEKKIFIPLSKLIWNCVGFCSLRLRPDAKLKRKPRLAHPILSLSSHLCSRHFLLMISFCFVLFFVSVNKAVKLTKRHWIFDG